MLEFLKRFGKGSDTGMKLIVGLGNPGRKYEKTKHNVGFAVIDYLAEKYRIPSSGISMKGEYGRGMIEGQKVMLLKPMTFMNLSGESVQPFVQYYKIDPEQDLILVYDDVDLEAGKIRVRQKGSAGGHNGMKSVIGRLGTDAFPRVRIGIGGKPAGWDLADYVLAPFDAETQKKVDNAVADAARAVELILQGEIAEAMNLYNKKDKKPRKDSKEPAEKNKEESAALPQEERKTDESADAAAFGSGGP